MTLGCFSRWSTCQTFLWWRLCHSQYCRSVSSCNAPVASSILTLHISMSASFRWPLGSSCLLDRTTQEKKRKCRLPLHGPYLLLLFHRRQCGWHSTEGKSRCWNICLWPPTLLFPFPKTVLCSHHNGLSWPCPLDGTQPSNPLSLCSCCSLCQECLISPSSSYLSFKTQLKYCLFYKSIPVLPT